jgi:hypothetical protein
MHFVDDILIRGDTQKEHDRRLKAVLERFREVNFTYSILRSVIFRRQK